MSRVRIDRVEVFYADLYDISERLAATKRTYYTQKQVRRSYLKFATFLRSKTVGAWREITEPVMLEYRDSLKSNGAEATASVLFCYARAILAEAKAYRRLAKNPAEDIQLKYSRKLKVNALKTEDLDYIWMAIEGADTRVIVGLRLLFEGLSLSEIVTLRTGDIDVRVLRVLGMSVSPETLEAIREHIRVWEIQGDGCLFPRVVKGGRLTEIPLTVDGLKKLIYQAREAFALPLPTLRVIHATVIARMFEGLSVSPKLKYKSLRNLRRILQRLRNQREK